MTLLTDEQWLSEWAAAGCSPAEMARRLGISERGVYLRKSTLEGRGYSLTTKSLNPAYAQKSAWTYPAAIDIEVINGTVLVGGDCHFWPGDNPSIWQAFVKVAFALRPAVIVLNGDVIEGTRVSRHPKLRNQNAPRLSQELSAARERLDELPANPGKFWTLGNHCTRLDNYLANNAPEMDDLAHSLSDRFPDWTICYSVLINGNTECRHMFAGGIHAAYQNAVKTGINVVTNHTHGNEVRSIIDRRGTRYAIETGMLNNPNAAQFEFDQGSVRRCAPGFALLTYDAEGELMPPERCEMMRGRPIFRNTDVLAEKPRVRVRADVGATI